MRRRILLADAPGPVAAEARRELEARGLDVEVAGPALAVEQAAAGRYDAAIVAGTERAPGVVAAMRAADPHLPLVVLALDAAGAPRVAELEEADGVVVAPLDGTTLATVCALAARVREGAERLGEVEATLARRETGSRELAFLKKLLFVEVKRSKRYGYPLSLALLEVDGWADAAAEPPAAARPELLAGLLGVVTRSVRDIDVAVPLSTERLVVLMPHTPADGALRVARRLCAVVRDHEARPRVTVSVGVASHPGDRTVSFGALVKRAGEALARARAAGGDRAEPADPPKKRDRISIG